MLFQFDQDDVSERFVGLDRLENYVGLHQGITLHEMIESNHKDLLLHYDMAHPFVKLEDGNDIRLAHLKIIGMVCIVGCVIVGLYELKNIFSGYH